FHAQADALAIRVGMAYGSDLDRLNYAYRLLYARTPSLEEVRDCRQFLAQARASLGGTAVPDDRKNREALASLMRVLMSANEFVTLDLLMSCDFSRRTMVRSLLLGSGLFPAVLNDLLAAETSPLAPKAPHFPGTARRVIFIYLSGGMSHVDSFDPKSKLAEYQREGKTAENNRKVMGSPWAAKPRGQCGTEITDLFPNIAECADDLCVVRTMRGDHNDHFQATLGIHTGSVTFKRPSVGSWVTYGLGTENQNLPCYVVLAPEMPYCGSQVWSSDFLPGVYSG